MNRIFLYTSFLCIIFFASFNSFTPAANTNITDDVFTQTNKFRKNNGLKELIRSDALNAIAQKHSTDMAGRRVGFGHSGFAKRNAMAKAKMPSLRYFAENVAFGASTGKEAVTMWKNSSGHRRNMLGRYTHIGIGIAKDKQGRIFYTQVFAG